MILSTLLNLQLLMATAVISGEIAYSCNYEDRRLSSDSDGRCPDYNDLKMKTFAPGCYSKSALNSPGSYSLSFDDCIAQ
jgi:hypothetical protein